MWLNSILFLSLLCDRHVGSKDDRLAIRFRIVEHGVLFNEPLSARHVGLLFSISLKKTQTYTLTYTYSLTHSLTH